MLWRSIHRSASTRKPQPNKRQSVGAGREARSGAITRQGSARQPIWAAWPPSARPAVSVGPLFTPCSSNPAPREPFSETMLVQPCSRQNGASRPRERRDDFQQVPGVAQAMPWIPGTGNMPAVPLNPLAGTHSAAEQNALVHEQNAVGYASDTRSGTLIQPARPPPSPLGSESVHFIFMRAIRPYGSSFSPHSSTCEPYPTPIWGGGISSLALRAIADTGRSPVSRLPVPRFRAASRPAPARSPRGHTHKNNSATIMAAWASAMEAW